MIVDGSYMAWARPTRRVHLALAAGTTVTGLILTVAGMTASRSATPTPPLLSGSAAGTDSAVSGDRGQPGAVLPAPLVRYAPTAPAVPTAPTVPSAKPHQKPASTAAPTPRHASHPTGTARLPAPAPSPSPARLPQPLPARPPAPLPARSAAPSPEPRPKHPPKADRD